MHEGDSKMNSRRLSVELSKMSWIVPETLPVREFVENSTTNSSCLTAERLEEGREAGIIRGESAPTSPEADIT
jgi:hypothetical protein